MKLWRFIVPQGEWRVDDRGDMWMGCAAAVVAEDREAALRHLRARAEEKQLRTGWLTVADVSAVDIEDGALALWVEI